MNSGWRPLGLPEGEVERLIGRLENERPTQISTKSRSPHDPDPAEPPFRKRLRRSQEICGSKILLSTYEVSGNCKLSFNSTIQLCSVGSVTPMRGPWPRKCSCKMASDIRHSKPGTGSKCILSLLPLEQWKVQ